MKKNTPTKKKPIKAHRGRIVYEGRSPSPFPSPFPRRPRGPRPFPMPFRRPGRPSILGRPPRRPPTKDPRVGTPVSSPMRPTQVAERPAMSVDRVAPTQRATRVDIPRYANPAMSRAEAQMRAAQARARRLMQADLSNRFQAAQQQRLANKGMVVTKKSIGSNDFRKGGLTLSTVDNRKKSS